MSPPPATPSVHFCSFFEICISIARFTPMHNYAALLGFGDILIGS